MLGSKKCTVTSTGFTWGENITLQEKSLDDVESSVKCRFIFIRTECGGMSLSFLWTFLIFLGYKMAKIRFIYRASIETELFGTGESFPKPAMECHVYVGAA